MSPKMVNYAAGRYWKNATYKDAFINFATDEETTETFRSLTVNGTVLNDFAAST
ncbi:MAG: hypothetical protein U0T77_11360 [Chitinophagales bacterium]